MLVCPLGPIRILRVYITLINLSIPGYDPKDKKYLVTMGYIYRGWVCYVTFYYVRFYIRPGKWIYFRTL